MKESIYILLHACSATVRLLHSCAVGAVAFASVLHATAVGGSVVGVVRPL